MMKNQNICVGLVVLILGLVTVNASDCKEASNCLESCPGMATRANIVSVGGDQCRYGDICTDCAHCRTINGCDGGSFQYCLPQDIMCTMAITYAVNPATGEVFTVNDGCIPDGWKVANHGCQKECNIECFAYTPVCGVNNVTYGCGLAEASCHNVEVACKGECPCPDCTIACLAYDPVCGVNNVTYACGEAEASCKRVDVDCKGECPCPKPQCVIACFQYDPVCGSDNNTYGCGVAEASCNNVEVSCTGPCPCAKCSIDSCGEKPLSTYQGKKCSNSDQTAGQLVCTFDPTTNQCTWTLSQCPECSCGVAIASPQKKCDDGIHFAGPSGKCLQYPDGSCGWEVLKCPEGQQVAVTVIVSIVLQPNMSINIDNIRGVIASALGVDVSLIGVSVMDKTDQMVSLNVTLTVDSALTDDMVQNKMYDSLHEQGYIVDSVKLEYPSSTKYSNGAAVISTSLAAIAIVAAVLIN